MLAERYKKILDFEDFKKILDFEDFWKFLIDKTSEQDAYWLDSWLERKLEEYANIDPCPQCQSRQRERINIYSKTGNYVLETIIKCSNCQYVISITDKRDYIKNAIERGDVKLKDVETLRGEVYTEQVREPNAKKAARNQYYNEYLNRKRNAAEQGK